jgi:hypothetical protein
MLIAKCIGAIESQREGAVVTHISRKTSEMWGTRQSCVGWHKRSAVKAEFIAKQSRTGFTEAGECSI